MAAPPDARAGRRWLRAALLCAAAYAVIGLVTAALASDAPSSGMARMWRLAAWALSAAVFAAHIRHERIRRAARPTDAALRAAAAVAVGGFVLAAAATARALAAGTGRIVLHVISLAAWPVLLAVPAFLVALLAASLLGRSKSA